MFRIQCQNPIFLQNPKLRENTEFEFVQLENITRRVTMSELHQLSMGVNVFDLFNINRPTCLTYEFCEKYNIIDSHGEVICLFIAVPCRNCNACRCSYVNSVRQRLLFGLQEFVGIVPLFVTLTYNDAHLPLGGMVCRKDIQSFIKRLRRNLERKYNTHIKFYYVSEYTPVTKRPHYHLVLYGFPRLSDNDVLNQYLRYWLIMYCWREPSFTMSFDEYKRTYPLIFNRPVGYDPQSFGYVNVCELSHLNCVNYICKYMNKQTSTSMKFKLFDPITKKAYYVKSRDYDADMRKKIFHGSSINLGLDFVTNHVKYNSTEIEFTDWLSRKVQKLNICGYYIDKLYPSLVQIVPVSVRRAFFNALDSIELLCYQKYIPNDIIVMLLNTKDYLLNNFPFVHSVIFYQDSDVKRYQIDSYAFNDLLCSISKNVDIVYQYVISHDFDKIFRSVADRDLVLARDELFTPHDYTRFALQMAECVNKQKVL